MTYATCRHRETPRRTRRTHHHTHETHAEV